MRIGKHNINDKSKVFIIAELGTNHMGDVKITKQMIDVAKSAGCDAVKLQKKNVIMM